MCKVRYTDGNTSALGHNFGDAPVVHDATCYAEGYTAWECSRCHYQAGATAADIKSTVQPILAHCMTIDNGAGEKKDYIYVYYEESVLLRQLTIYPYVQLGVVAIFFIVAIVALLASKRAEQNKVWVGLSRETAHQLGTPISSLMAWSEVLRESYPDDALLPEMNKDIARLQLIAERFSKIGSAPELTEQDVCPIVQRVGAYFRHRTSSRVTITVSVPPQAVTARVNAPLLEWVFENLCKNAIDAMQGAGNLTLTLKESAIVEKRKRYLRVEVSDTGKGIAKNHFQRVFKPGFTTKRRGWGLGLSLAKRIVEEYHHGRIYVLASEVGQGTTFAVDIEQC